MNSAAEEVRNGRRGNEPKGANQQRSNAGSRDGTPGATQSRRGGKSGGGGGGPNPSRSGGENAQNGSAAQTVQDEHVPIAGSNLDAVEAALKRGFDTKAPTFKPEAKPQATKSESPWGAKPGTMANGKDFWVELRKQIYALQQSGGTSQGG